MKHRSLVLAVLFTSTISQGQIFQSRAGVQFYFSDVGGSSERLTQDVVTSANWTGQYDIYAKNTRNQSIRFDAGVLLLGYARSNFFGGAAAMLPGTDKITLLDPSANGALANATPNITARAPWFVGNVMTSLVGGRGVPDGSPRPYGLNIPMDPVNGTPISIASGESIFLARIALRDNGLFASQGFHDIVLYDSNPSSNYASSSLIIPEGDNLLVYHDGPNWESNSRLRLQAVPEPASLVALGMLMGLLRLRRRPPVR